MVNDKELGLGSFVPISDEDREIVREALMCHIVVAPDERDAILAVARAHHREWHRLSDADHDMRIFNAGTDDTEATLVFYSQAGGEPKTAHVTIPAGQVRQFDRALSSIFNTANDGGALHIITASPARLVATARTYNQTGNGTYGWRSPGPTSGSPRPSPASPTDRP